MLEVGKPDHRRIGQPPSEEAPGLEDGIDLMRAELCRRSPVQTQRQRGEQTATACERRRLHNLYAGYRSHRREIGIIPICSCEQDGRNFTRTKPFKGFKQVALIVVAAGPELARNMGKRNT